jgi:GT2 family glycosyltransferase
VSEASPTSVVIPTYLRPDSLEDCVHSLLDGTLRPDEIIVVGRASDQATRQVVEKLCSRDGDFTRLRSAWVNEAGHIPPVEAGLRLASGELIAFIDDDVTVTPQWLALILRHFSDPSVGVVGGRVVVPQTPPPKLRGKPGHVTWYGKTWGNVGSVSGDRVREVDAVMEGNWVWRRDLLRSLEVDSALNFDDASMYGLDLCLQAKASGFRVLYDPQALVYHHAKPRAPELDRAQRPARAFSYCRNYTYILLKHLPAWRKPVFLAWWFGIGERAAVGLAAWIANAVYGRAYQPGETRAAFAGKIEGIRLWRTRGKHSRSVEGLASAGSLKQNRVR